MNKKLRGSLLLLLATVIWGSAFVSQSVAMDHMQPFTFQAIRCFLAVLIMVVIVFIWDKLRKNTGFFARWMDKKLWLAGLLCGVPLFFACNLQQLALVDVDAGKSGFLTAMYIVFVPIIGLFRKQKPSILVPVSVVIAVAGLYFLSCVGVTQVQTGDLLLLGCAVMFAVQINMVDRFVDQVDPLRLNTLQALVCAVLSTIAAFTEQPPALSDVAVCIVPLTHVGFLSMGAAYALQILGQKDLPQAPAALIMSLESVFAAVFGWLLLQEKMSGAELLGSGLVFLAVILSQIEIRPQIKSVREK